MKLYAAAILAISFLDIFNEGIVRGSFGSQMMPQNQCIDLHTKEIDVKRISSYEEHERPFKAVIFIRNDGFRICVPHDLQWVQEAMKNLSQRPKPRKLKKPKSSKPRNLKKPKSSSRLRIMSTSRPDIKTS